VNKQYIYELNGCLHYVNLHDAAQWKVKLNK